MIKNKGQWARAFARAFAADMSRRPHIAGSPAGLRKQIFDDLAREARGEAPVLFPELRAFLRTFMNIEEERLSSGMGQWAELINSVTQAAGSYFTAREKAKTQEKIAEIQLKAQQVELARQQAAAEEERRRMAAAEGASPSVTSGARTGAPGGGPSTGVLVAVGAVAVAGVTKIAGVW